MKQLKRMHNKIVAMDRREYKMKRYLAILHLNAFCSIIIDGADKFVFGLLHFITSTKYVRNHAMKVKLVRVLEQGKDNTMRLFTMI